MNKSSTQPQSAPQKSQNGQSTPPTIDYWHVWTDENGVSHQTRCQIQNFDSKSVAPPADPQWMGQLKQEGAKTVFVVLPVGWVGTWHENPKPQWIVPLSGRWFVETMDGQRVEMGPGDISFGEDQNTREDDQGRKGHLSGTVGDEPAKLMLIQLDQDATVAQSCRFK
jgi:hypothetical protein